MIVSKYIKIDGKLYVEASDYDKLLCELKHSNDKIAALESKLKSRDNVSKINLNDKIKVKLTPFGANLYYKQYDELNKEYGKEILKPRMPMIDKDGYTEFQLHHFMRIYGEYMYAGAIKVIEPIGIVVCDERYSQDSMFVSCEIYPEK